MATAAVAAAVVGAAEAMVAVAMAADPWQQWFRHLHAAREIIEATVHRSPLSTDFILSKC